MFKGGLQVTKCGVVRQELYKKSDEKSRRIRGGRYGWQVSRVK